MKKWLDKVLFCHVYPSPEILSLQGTLEFIKSSHCSISRFGDGEIKLISGKDLAFQPYSVELGNRLKEVLSSNLQGHLVCLPDIFKSLSLFTPSAANHWRGHLSKYRKIWSRLFDPSHGPYGKIRRGCHALRATHPCDGESGREVRCKHRQEDA